MGGCFLLASGRSPGWEAKATQKTSGRKNCLGSHASALIGCAQPYTVKRRGGQLGGEHAPYQRVQSLTERPVFRGTNCVCCTYYTVSRRVLSSWLPKSLPAPRIREKAHTPIAHPSPLPPSRSEVRCPNYRVPMSQNPVSICAKPFSIYI